MERSDFLKLKAIIFICFLLVGCISNNSENDLNATLTPEIREEYLQLTDKILYENYWYYDNENVEIYYDKIDLSKNEYKASKSFGLNLEIYKDKYLLVSSTDIFHINQEKAGKATLYFDDTSLAGAYYTPKNDKNKVSSLEFRNVFSKEADIQNFETENLDNLDYNSYPISTLKNGFVDIEFNENGETLFLIEEEKSISIYKMTKNNNIFLYAQENFNSASPISSTFYRDEKNNIRVATLVGSYKDYYAGSDKSYFISEKVIFLNEHLKKLNFELDATSLNYSCIGEDNGDIILIDDNSLEVYRKIDESFEKIEQKRLGHGATFFKKDDLDKDGNYEYIISNDVDLYIYQYNNSDEFTNIWRTNLINQNFVDTIYTGDLNNDGVKEIYILDKTGTTIKYILTDMGLKTENENIEFGHKYYVGDFNKDNRSDFIKFTSDDIKSNRIYIAK